MEGAPTLTWRIGERVLVRGRRWQIVDAARGTDCVALGLGPEGDEPRPRRLTLLTPFDRPQRLELRRRPRVVTMRRWFDELRRRMCIMRPFGALAATARSTVRLMPYQLEPALAMLRHGATRMLIADAVGMGKTIQAGVLLAELAARSEMFRGLVLVPAGLRDQWTSELHDQFGLEPIVADAGWLRATNASHPPDVNPWALPGIHVVSSDFVKRPDVLRALEDLMWDLLVVDEAHATSSRSDRRVAAHAVASRSRRVLLLTATPHADDPAEFDSLCRIGDVGGSGPILLFRRSRGDAGAHTPRRSVVLLVRPSAAEQRMHSLLEQYTRQIWNESRRRKDDLAKLAVVVLRKRALSSAASLASSVRRRMDLLAGGSPQLTQQLWLPLGDEELLEDAQPDAALGAPGLSDPRRERRWLAAVAEAAHHAARRETKTAFLLRLLARVREPFIVFTEYRDTLVRLERMVARSGRSTAVLHGGMTRAERTRVQRAFNETDMILIATDAAAEGLNLQARCRALVHYELPWRMSRLEQRAGRVDRLGQSKRVHEIALVAADTAERLVLAPLARRAAQAAGAAMEASSLLAALTESRIADLVMAGTPPVPPSGPEAVRTQAPSVTIARRAESEEEVARLERVRRFAPGRGLVVTARERPFLSEIRRRRSLVPAGAILIFRLALSLRDGRVVHEEPLSFHVQLKAGTGRLLRIRLLRNVCALFGDLHHPLLRGGFESAASRALCTAGRLHAHTLSQLTARDRAIATARSSPAAQLVQTGLFDSRAVRELARREHARNSRPENATTEESGAQGDLHHSAELIAALVVGPGPRFP